MSKHNEGNIVDLENGYRIFLADDGTCTLLDQHDNFKGEFIGSKISGNLLLAAMMAFNLTMTS